MLYLIKREDEWSRKGYDVFSKSGNKLARIEYEEHGIWGNKDLVYRVNPDIAYGGESFKTIIEAKRYILDVFKTNQEPQDKGNIKSKIKYLPYDEETLKNFYPTPHSLVGKMISKVKWKEVRSILEPSAGKGDIVDCIKQAAHSYQKLVSDRIRDFDCIEIDPDLRAILKGKEYRVVGDDFLTFSSQKRYDLIIMNPPFDNGAAHLMKAIQMQREGGQVVCLLNAETLRNPYTLQRQALLKVLLKYNASVEYVKNAFSKAERKTDVEIAIVSLDIPKPEFKSDIFERMKRAEEIKVEMEESREVASTDFLTNLVAEYNVEANAGIEFIKQYFGMIPYMRVTKPKETKDSEMMSPLMLEIERKPIIKLEIGDHTYTEINEAINAFVKCVRRKFWTYALKSKEFSANMTSDMQNEYSDKIREMEEYEFSRFNLETVLTDILKNITRGVEDSIMKLFDKLSSEHSYFPECANNVHYYNGWCSNKAHKVNMKCIIPTHGIVADYSWSKCFEVREAYYILSDLEKALNYLSGEGPESFIDLETLLEVACSRGQKTKINCKYFEVSFYKKGTTHIKFYNKDLIDKLNIFAAQNKNWLPPCYGKVRYDDMSAEEKAVVDEFQTREEYQRVYENPSQMLFDANHTTHLLMSSQTV